MIFVSFNKYLLQIKIDFVRNAAKLRNNAKIIEVHSSIFNHTNSLTFIKKFICFHLNAYTLHYLFIRCN